MSYFKQLVVGTAANLGTIACGMTLGFSAVALPAMQSADPPVTDEEASWIASLISIGMPAGCLLMGPLLDGLGRRRTLMLVNTPAVLGWLLIATAPHNEHAIYLVYAGRLLTGLAEGLICPPAVVYVSEVMEKTLRGMIVTWPSIGVSLGILLVYILGSIFKENWRLVAGICTCVPFVAIIAVWYLLPESPVWLASRGNVQEAELSLRRIRNVPLDKSLPESIQEEMDAMLSSTGRHDRKSSWRDTFAFLKRPEAYKPLVIFNAFFLFQQFSGIFVIILYAVSIIQETKLNFDGYLASILIGVTRLIISILISFAARKYGRRVLCNISGVGMTLSMTALAGFLILMNNGTFTDEIVAKHSWFPIAALLLSVLTATLGFLTLPFAMIGEVFPVKIRGSACGFTMFIATVMSFAAIKLFPEMKNALGYHNVFTFYAVVAALGTVCMYFYLPETHGKTLDEIEEYFRSGGEIRDHDKTTGKLLTDNGHPKKVIVVEET